MSEGDKEKDTDQVEPLEAKPGGKTAGTRTVRIIAAVSDEKEEDKE